MRFLIFFENSLATFKARLFSALLKPFSPLRSAFCGFRVHLGSFSEKARLSGTSGHTLKHVAETFAFFLLTFFRFIFVGHRYLVLILVFALSFLFFHPGQVIASFFDKRTYCPDRYAYQLENNHYIRCEDFDLFFEEQAKGRKRKDLYLK